MKAEVKPRGRWRSVVGGLSIVLAVVALVWWVVSVISKPGEVKKKRAVQEIALLKPPPPPPPPKVEPPKVVPPKETIQEKVDVPKPDQQPDKPPDAPPPGPDLGVDAKGSGSGDSFGLVGKKGGSDLIGGGGTGGNRFAWYGALMKERILEAVFKDKKLREASDYRINVNVWVSATGAVTRVELAAPSDNPELDSAVKAALFNLPPLREGAPVDMPQPIKLRISAR